MKRVKIISGIYGYRPEGAKRPHPVSAGSFVTVSDEEAARLSDIKVGVIVGTDAPIDEPPVPAVATPPVDTADDGAGENPPEEVGASEGLVVDDAIDIEDGHFTIESLMKLTRPNMEKLAEDLGVDVKKCKNKTEIAAALAAVELEPAETDDEPPAPGVEAPVM